MNRHRRMLALFVLAALPVIGSVATAQPANADVWDAADYTAHAPGYVYDICTGPGVGYLPGPVVCAIYAVGIPGTIVYEATK